MREVKAEQACKLNPRIRPMCPLQSAELGSLPGSSDGGEEQKRIPAAQGQPAPRDKGAHGDRFIPRFINQKSLRLICGRRVKGGRVTLSKPPPRGRQHRALPQNSLQRNGAARGQAGLGEGDGFSAGWGRPRCGGTDGQRSPICHQIIHSGTHERPRDICAQDCAFPCHVPLT